MSGFRVGDVCVVVSVTWASAQWMVGKECTVIELHEPDYVRTDINSEGSFFYPHNLRLKRPPSWDKWIYDTSDVDSHETVSA